MPGRNKPNGPESRPKYKGYKTPRYLAIQRRKSEQAREAWWKANRPWQEPGHDPSGTK